MTAISICTTNYNCGHALDRHLSSLFRVLHGLDYEYIAVDDYSKDESWDILQSWIPREPKMKVFRRRCTMGEGRELAFRRSRGAHVMVVDTDVVYHDILRRFVERYLDQWSGYSVQAIFCGMFPRDQWEKVGGRRSLNTNEDVDMWVRIHRLGTMRWYPVPMGDNFKEPKAWGRGDHLSSRYTGLERTTRLLRREWDLLKTRHLAKIDLGELVRNGTIDLGLGPIPGPWPQNRTRLSRREHVANFGRDLQAVVRRRK